MVEKLPTIQRNPVPVQSLPGASASETAPTYVPTDQVPPGYVPVVPQQNLTTAAAPPVVVPTAADVAQPAGSTGPGQPDVIEPQVVIVSHSTLYYWWPVWAVGYIMALLTLMEGVPVQLGQFMVNIHPSNNLGVLFFLTLFLVILISNVIVRGLASALVIMGMALATVVFAYFGWWDSILGWVGELTIFLNQGAYFWFSTLIFIVWLVTVFGFDRTSYWRVRPGQMTHEVVLGSSSRSYDTENMTFDKIRNDVFRHWLLGLGSGDLIVHAFSGGKPEEIHIPNVLFIGSKIRAIQELIATRPAEIEQQAAGRR